MSLPRVCAGVPKPVLRVCQRFAVKLQAAVRGRPSFNGMLSRRAPLSDLIVVRSLQRWVAEATRPRLTCQVEVTCSLIAIAVIRTAVFGSMAEIAGGQIFAHGVSVVLDEVKKAG